MTKVIPLKQGTATLVDDADYARFAHWDWHLSAAGYAVRWIRQDGGLATRLLHREILEAQPGQLIDHRDGNPLNNCRANLRIVDRTQNNWNRRPNQGCRYKGVSWHKQHGKWQVRIQANEQRRCLGLYNDPQHAAHVYDAASQILHGDYARLNFPDSPIDPAIQARVLQRLRRFSQVKLRK